MVCTSGANRRRALDDAERLRDLNHLQQARAGCGGPGALRPSSRARLAGRRPAFRSALRRL